MKTFKQLPFIIFSFGLLLYILGCEREWGNPFDDKSAIDPESWAPQNFQIQDVTPVEKKLTWTFDDKNIEGFKLDRKIGDEPWHLGFQTFTKETRSWNDTGIIPDPALTYTYRLYAYAGKNKSAQKSITVSAAFFSCGTMFTDTRDNQVYATIEIGNQCWMKENLKWLPSVSPPTGGSSTSARYYVYGYNGTSVSAAKATTNYQSYGVLYNWTAALNACPQGWHLPSDSEWTVLVDYLGGSSVAGGKMKTTGTTHWASPNSGATNSSGFSGLPGGYRAADGPFYYVGGYGFWWSATESSAANAWGRFMYYDYASVYRGSYTLGYGFSVRCVRD